MVFSLSLIAQEYARAAAPGQAGSLSNMVPLLSNGANAANSLGTQSIAQGTQNQTQGEQTQNMAQMAMGAMQIAQGLLGLMAGAAASKKSETSGSRESGLSALNPSYSPPSSNSGAGSIPEIQSSNLGSASVTSSLDPGELRKEPLNTGLSSIEKNFGIPRDSLVAALQNGVDPKAIFANAPKNAVSPDLLNRISEGLAAGNFSGTDAAKALAASSASSDSLASVGGAGTGGVPSGSSSGEGNTARMPASTSPGGLEDINSPGVALSPEIKAAMAAKADQIRREKEMTEMHGWSIFQLVANRYRKLEPMLYGRVERTNPVLPQSKN